MAEAIRRFAANGRDYYTPATMAAAATARTEEEHFKALFAAYEDILARTGPPHHFRAAHA